jgi:glycolate oxidase iron-sulfur subunit
MQTNLADFIRNTPDGDEADAILRNCVHCGFCTATCPTYQLLGDELDGPRGRIYLIKQMVEGAEVTRSTQVHLDRCLTCRNCETTCPSGVQYGKLVEIGRKITEEKVTRPLGQRLTRRLLASFVPNSALFTPTMRVGQHFRALLPRKLRDKVPARQRPLTWPSATHTRKMLMLAGCVQPSMMPNVNTATARVLDALGIETVVAPAAAARSGCTSATTTKRSTTCAPTSTHGGRMSNRASRRS